MALDVIGAVPTADEVATLCTGKTPEQMARALLATPKFRDVERRFWIRRVAADPTALMADHIADADRLYDGVADGTLGYDDFIAQLLAHPIMTLHRPVADGDDVTATVQHIFRVVLGRAASGDEVADYANLLRPWQRRFEDRYTLGYGYYIMPAAIAPGACRDAVLGAAACTSTLLGEPTTIAPDVTPQVPPGYSQTSDSLFYYETVEGNVPAALEAELEKPGRLLATRDELWDEAADLSLARFTGWWRSTANEPDTVLPEVRRAAAEWFRGRDKRDLRELYVVVLTSLLYTTSAEVTTPGERPPWATGPTKVLEPEQLLDSVGHALDRELGFCDPHTDEPVGRNFYWPNRLRATQPPDWYGFNYDLYLDIGQQLGGCIGAVAPPRSPGLPALLTHIDVARTLCTTQSAILPVGVDPRDTSAAAATAIADHLFARFLARPPADDERAQLAASATACYGDPACNDAEGLARELCGALVRSTAFLYY